MRTDSLVKCIDKLGGIATAAQLKEVGFTPGLIEHAYRRGAIDKLTRGVYCSADVFDDEFAAVCARWKKCVLSHGSALYLLGLSDRIPFSLEVTVPHGYNPKSLKDENPGIYIHHVSPKLHNLGIIEVKTPMGNRARCYDAERSIADLIKERSRRGVDAQLMHDAIGGYFKMDGRDLTRLPRCAKQWE